VYDYTHPRNNRKRKRGRGEESKGNRQIKGCIKAPAKLGPTRLHPYGTRSDAQNHTQRKTSKDFWRTKRVGLLRNRHQPNITHAVWYIIIMSAGLGGARREFKPSLEESTTKPLSQQHGAVLGGDYCMLAERDTGAGSPSKGTGSFELKEGDLGNSSLLFHRPRTKICL